MSATNSTTNYNLPIFIASDSPKWLVDWNGAMNTIDSAINTVATAASGAAGDITSLQSDLQTLSGTVTTQGTSISTLTSSLSTLTGTVNTITSLIGNGEPTTTDKTIIGAINELHSDIQQIVVSVDADDVSYDNTTSGLLATNVQSAIDELAAAAPTDTNEIKERIKNKKILVIGDSLSVDSTTWVESLKTVASSVNATVTNISVNGASTSSALALVNDITDVYDIAIIWLGVNDAYTSVNIGDQLTANSFSYNYKAIISKLLTLNSVMQIYTYAITFASNSTYYKNKSTYSYNAAIRALSTQLGCVFRDISHVISADINNTTSMESDGVHFKEAFSKSVIYEIISKGLLSFTSDNYVEPIRCTGSGLTAGTDITINSADIVNIAGCAALLKATFTVGNATATNAVIFTLPSVLKAGSTAVSIRANNISNGTQYFLTLSGNTVSSAASLPSGIYFCESFFVPEGDNLLQYL